MAQGLHLVFVHGWYGDHTSFQSFPTDLHNNLLPKLPPDVTLNTHIYPTYKARRPIQETTDKLILWLEALPPQDEIILAGHSLGGYLVADAALGSQTNASLKGRIIGFIAFDTPYLGIHPHVIISGLASLVPDKGAKETEMNDQSKVNIPSPQSSVLSLDPPSPPPIVHRSSSSIFDKASKFISKHGHDPIGQAKTFLTEAFEFGSSVIDKDGLSARYTALEKWGDPGNSSLMGGSGGDWIHFFTVATKRERNEQGELIAPSSPPMSPGLPSSSNSPYPSHLLPSRHGTDDAPATVGSIPVEINPYGMDAKPEEVTATGTAREFDKFKEAARRQKAKLDAKMAEKMKKSKSSSPARSPSPSLTPRASPPSTPGGDSELAKTSSSLDPRRFLSHHDSAASTTSISSATSADPSSSPQSKKKHHPHHFIVLPWAMSYRWQGIPIEGVDDEVEAHTGIFFRDKNFEYDSLVERTGIFVLGVVLKRHGAGGAKVGIAPA